ncbi:MAG: thiamine phosphate synthase [Acidobacteria bacterium]|nr:thiamine phosphate synthase [Acidobacteriota bacterium]
MLQLRRKGLDVRTLVETGKAVAAAVGGMDVTLLMNGSVEAAVRAGFQGVHLPAFTPGVAAIRASLPAGFRIGMSVHDGAELADAEKQGADFVVLGPVFPPRCKAAGTAPLGLARLRELAGGTRMPTLALGGISADNAEDALACGVAGLAGISFFHHPGELERILKRIGG